MKLLNKFAILCIFNLALGIQAAYSQEEKKELPIDIGLIAGLYDLIDRAYVDEVDKKKVYISAIKGMLSGLDPHSDFLEPKEQKNLEEHSNGTFGGIGIVINKKDDFIEIVSPIDDTPGYRAGLKSGDTIIKIDDKLIRKMSLEDAVELMRGTPGTTVVLTISRKDTSPFEVKIVRDIITVISAKGYLLDKDVGYLRISSFQAPTAKLVLETLEKLKKENNGELKSIILDLRNNPGGLITSAIAISNLFLDGKKLVVYTKGRSEDDIKYFAKEGDNTNGAKVLVLVNKGSASASEIVAGALQDHKRAVVVGAKTFGKGSVQSVIPLKGGYGIKLTIARYYTPNGRSIQAKGIEPDVVLEDLQVSEKDKALVNIGENDLENHIKSNDDKEKSSTNSQADADAKALENAEVAISDEEKQRQEDIDTLKKDYFVIQAMNILKALNLGID